MKTKTRTTPKETDQARFAKLLDGWGVEAPRFVDPEFLTEEARKAGAVISIGARDGVDFYFNKRGRFIGTATPYRDSWRPRRKR